jgi:hypothetical protein
MCAPNLLRTTPGSPHSPARLAQGHIPPPQTPLNPPTPTTTHIAPPPPNTHLPGQHRVGLIDAVHQLSHCRQAQRHGLCRGQQGVTGGDREDRGQGRHTGMSGRRHPLLQASSNIHQRLPPPPLKRVLSYTATLQAHSQPYADTGN